jgi:hypothetical protein
MQFFNNMAFFFAGVSGTQLGVTIAGGETSYGGAIIAGVIGFAFLIAYIRLRRKLAVKQMEAA